MRRIWLAQQLPRTRSVNCINVGPWIRYEKQNVLRICSNYIHAIQCTYRLESQTQALHLRGNSWSQSFKCGCVDGSAETKHRASCSPCRVETKRPLTPTFVSSRVRRGHAENFLLRPNWTLVPESWPYKPPGDVVHNEPKASQAPVQITPLPVVTQRKKSTVMRRLPCTVRVQISAE